MNNDIYVLDTSAILSGKIFEKKSVTSPKVLKEIKPKGHSWRMFEFMRSKGMELIEPPKEVVEMVKKVAIKTGDYANLSEVDIEIIALAFYLNAILLTDDYSMQNVAKEMGIKFKSIVEEGIKEKIYWKFRCKFCGKDFDKYYEECPICGGKLKRIRKT